MYYINRKSKGAVTTLAEFKGYGEAVTALAQVRETLRERETARISCRPTREWAAASVRACRNCRQWYRSYRMCYFLDISTKSEFYCAHFEKKLRD